MLMRGGTKRDETRPTDGAIVARTAEMLGKPLLPTSPGKSTLPPERTITTVWCFPLRASAARAR
jgi:hypothetical protein